MRRPTEQDILYVKGDATDPRGDGTKIIVHCCNDLGLWGAGFVLAISEKWRVVEDAYRAWAATKNEKKSSFRLGEYQLVSVAPGSDILVCNLIGQEGVKVRDGKIPLRYEALRRGMKSLSIIMTALPNNPSVHMPYIGCGLAGGDWGQVEPIILDTFVKRRIPVTVYEWVPPTH